MAGRTIAIGDIHGDVWHLERILGQLPPLDADDTLVFLGDYLDRGPQSAQVIDLVRTKLPTRTPARIVALRGNHEDAWLRVIDRGWPEFVLPPGNGCLACLRSFHAGDYPGENEGPGKHEVDELMKGSFFPPEVVAWMRTLSFWYEDEHAIYVHAGLPWKEGRWLHPSEVEEPLVLLWIRTEEFFVQYRGKMVICGHTTTDMLPPELSMYTPDDPTDLWQGENVLAIDTGCGKGGFLTAVELPAMIVYESR
ncbi:MAG: serine/threonine protein phosphatase [Deltaproteobacteria bacterium]|nr:serine/threonine protein phosphatase [Deltaproteobacteria bacterium]